MRSGARVEALLDRAVTRAASAAPPVAFITWPTKKPVTGLPAR